VVHRATEVAGTLRCDPTPLRSPAGQPAGDTVTGTDPTGTYVVGGATLWTGSRPAVIIRPDATAPAVNSSGTVLLRGGDVNWRLRNGATQELAVPAGYRRARATHVNGRGDAVGVASSPVDLNAADTALVVWPADRPDSPRVVRERDSEPLAIRDDGTVISARYRSETDLGVDRIVVIRPDGTRVPITVPRQLTTRGSMLNATVHGDYLYSSAASAEITYDDGETPLADLSFDPVRWNLRTGLIEVFDDLRSAPVGGADGSFVAVEETTAAVVLVAPDRVTSRFPVAGGTVRAVAAAGTTLVGFAEPDAVSWHCVR
jgi:hypothetical protein